MDSIVIHYDEIGLKGKNRPAFERLLMDNIRHKTRLSSLKRETGQMTLTAKPTKKLKGILSKIPGIAYFSPAKKCSLNIDELKQQAITLLKNKKFETFKVDTHRHNKDYKLSSLELNQILGEAILNSYKKRVKMESPELILKVEISNSAYLSTESIRGVGGLPTNPRQKIIALISGGIDSPVAAYMMMKRGCKVILIHFRNKNQLTSLVKEKITSLAKQLSKFQIITKLYTIPFEKLQNEIIKNSKSEIRMLIYRRFMLKIASEIAKKEKARFLTVGDSLSQVASQTIENLEATYEASEIPILTPLIGLNKNEIIQMAKSIGTYDISALPYPDCCTYFLSKHPELRANLNELKRAESIISKSLVNELVKKAKAKTFGI